MSAYIIIHIDVNDPASLASYQELARPSMEEHGIKLIKKSAAPPALEGESPGRITVLLEADSEAAARKWYDSDGYKKAIEARAGLAAFTTVLMH